MKSILNNEKGIMPARNFQTSRPCKVRRSGQVITFAVCAVFSLSFQAAMLLTKTAITHRVFFYSSLR